MVGEFEYGQTLKAQEFLFFHSILSFIENLREKEPKNRKRKNMLKKI